MLGKSITLVDRTFILNGTKYHYIKEGVYPYEKFDEALSRGKVKEGDFAERRTLLTEVLPSNKERTIISDIDSKYIKLDRKVQKVHSRFNHAYGYSVTVVKEADGNVRRYIKTPKGERLVYGTNLSLGKGDWLDLASNKSFKEHINEAREQISADFITRLRGLSDSEAVQRHVDFINKRLRSLNELGENSYKLLIRIMKKARI